MADLPADGAIAYLQTFNNWETKLQSAGAASFALDRVEKLLAVFGRPDSDLRFAHVAGTKGKGSACAFLAAILRASGYRTGLYTSPHLHSLSERIRVLEPGVPAPGFDGAITLREIGERLLYYRRDIDQLRASGVEITFYELMTVLAISLFASRQTRLVVLETGLGGRLDATNAVETSVCGITPVGLDHMNILGVTPALIAAEKAGIIRSSSQRVTLAPQVPEVMAVLREHCRALGIRPTVVGEDLPCAVHEMTARGVRFTVEGRRRYDDLFSPLTGAHQAENAALAIGMAEDLETYGYVITAESVREGIRSVHWPARFEPAGTVPVVILDCAHTPESAEALERTFSRVYPGRKAVVVLGMSADKDARAFVKALSQITGALVLTKADNPRAMDIAVDDVCAIVPGAELVSASDVTGALVRARQMAGKDGIILVTGSVFVCAEAREKMRVPV